jgi:hypothetical protein
MAAYSPPMPKPAAHRKITNVHRLKLVAVASVASR